jgi:hypothetical protein
MSHSAVMMAESQYGSKRHFSLFYQHLQYRLVYIPAAKCDKQTLQHLPTKKIFANNTYNVCNEVQLGSGLHIFG